MAAVHVLAELTDLLDESPPSTKRRRPAERAQRIQHAHDQPKFTEYLRIH